MTSSPDPGQKPASQKNIIIALLLSAILWLATELWMKPKMPQPSGTSITSSVPKGESLWPYVPSEDKVFFQNPHCKGYLDCRGAVFYHWSLKGYHKDTSSKQKSSQEPSAASQKLQQENHVTLLSPEEQYLSLQWYKEDTTTTELPTTQTLWTPSQEHFHQGHDKPLTLTWTNGDDLEFSYTVSMDDHYMLFIEQKVRNKGHKTHVLGVKGGFTRSQGSRESMVHGYEGPLGVFQGKYREIGYKTLLSKEVKDLALGSSGSSNTTSSGSSNTLDGKESSGNSFDKDSGTKNNGKKSWMGFSEKYWLSALIPQSSSGGLGFFFQELSKTSPHQSLFFGYYHSPVKEIKPGEEHVVKTSVFLGPKVLSLLEMYEKKMSLDHFDLAVDFGWFYFLTKPFLQLLSLLKSFLGNFGLAILVMTIMVKGLFFPLSLRSHRSMMKMKAIQPKIDHLRQVYSQDKMRLNQEIMALYKKEKFSPASGCLPMILQMPVFFALYKVFSISIEMRQAPFWGWVQDMSLPDPTSIFNLFGLFSFGNPFGFSLGAWPLLMGLTMFIQQKKQLNNTIDAHQRMMLLYFMPLMFVFFMAQLPVGLVIYSTWNNILTMVQQSIMTVFFSSDTGANPKVKRLDVPQKTWLDTLKAIFKNPKK